MLFLEKSFEITKYIHIHLPKTNGWNPKIGGLEDDWTWNQGGNRLHVSFRDCISFQSRRHKKFIIFGGMSYSTKMFGKKMKHKAILHLFRKWFLVHQFKRKGQTHTITTFLSKKNFKVLGRDFFKNPPLTDHCTTSSSQKTWMKTGMFGDSQPFPK